MKHLRKVFLLVALAILFTMAACTRQASTGPAVAPSGDDEAPFPYTTPSNRLEALGTLTAIAEAPEAEAEATATPEVIVEPAQEQEQPPASGQSADTPAPPPAPAPAANIPPITRPESYTLQRGEWPLCIARRFDLEISSFFQANGLSMASKPNAGVVLRIPSSGNWNPANGSRALKSHPTTYQVSANDTVNSIACSFGDVSPEQILAANNLSGPSEITPGMTINIP